MKIPTGKLDQMFEIAEVSKSAMYNALIQMGRKHLKTKQFKDQWSEDNPTKNYCYVIAEFVWFYVAPAGSKPYSVRVPGDDGLHRFVRWPDGTIIDLAVEQFDNYEEVDYSKQKVRYPLQSGCVGPSKRARLLAELMGFNPNKWSNPDETYLKIKYGRLE